MRVVAMNEPVTIERALIGREIALEDPTDDGLAAIDPMSSSTSPVQNHPPSPEPKAVPVCRKLTSVETGHQFNSLKSSNILLTTKREDLTKNFEISATIRMLDDAGVVFVVTVSLKPTDRSYSKAVPKFSALSHGALGKSVERPSKSPRSAQLS